MSLLVHLADERDSARIKKNGIKIRKYGKGIFCMPVLQNFYISHQWLRELKRFGGNTFVGVYFKVDSSEKVFAGKYHEPHRCITLGEAINEIQSIEDPLGYELIIDRKIAAKDIHDIRHLPQHTGWRYRPGENGKKPCGCNHCQRGKVKAKSIREKYGEKEDRLTYDEIMEKLSVENEEYKIENLLSDLSKKRRFSDPNRLLFLLDNNSDSIDQQLALTLKKFRHKNTRAFLTQLLKKENSDTREYAADSLLKLYGKEVEESFLQSTDKAIQTAIEDWKKESAK